MVRPGKVAGQDTAFSLGSDRHDAPSEPHVQQRRDLQPYYLSATLVQACIDLTTRFFQCNSRSTGDARLGTQALLGTLVPLTLRTGFEKKCVNSLTESLLWAEYYRHISHEEQASDSLQPNSANRRRRPLQPPDPPNPLGPVFRPRRLRLHEETTASNTECIATSSQESVPVACLGVSLDHKHLPSFSPTSRSQICGLRTSKWNQVLSPASLAAVMNSSIVISGRSL